MNQPLENLTWKLASVSGKPIINYLLYGWEQSIYIL